MLLENEMKCGSAINAMETSTDFRNWRKLISMVSFSLSLNAMHIASKLRNLSFKSTQFEMRLLLFGCAYVCVCVDACKSVSVSQTNDDIGYSGFELAAGAQ